MKLENYCKIKLLTDKYKQEGVKKGDSGYIIEVYKDGYEVEFSDNQGNTIALFSVKPEEVEEYKNQ